MDLTKVLKPALNLISAALPGLILFGIVLLIIWICKTRWFKGWFGEKFISFWFRRSLGTQGNRMIFRLGSCMV